MSMVQGLLMEFEMEAATTRKLLEVVPEDKLGWKPHDKSMTLGRLAGHVAEIPGWGGAILCADHFDMETAGDFKPLEPTSVKQLLEAFDEFVAGFKEQVGKLEDAALMQPWQLRKGAQVLSEMPRIGAARGFIFSHTVHHRGQLSVYLRLLDVPVPSVYGPTADDSGGF